MRTERDPPSGTVHYYLCPIVHYSSLYDDENGNPLNGRPAVCLCEPLRVLVTVRDGDAVTIDYEDGETQRQFSRHGLMQVHLGEYSLVTEAVPDPANGFDPGVPGTWAGVYGVCSRNLDLAYDETQTQWVLAVRLGLHDLCAREWPGSRVAVQGKTYGEGVQGNPLKVRGQAFAVFTVLVDGRELPRADWPAWLVGFAVPEVPGLVFPGSVEGAVAQVEVLESVVAPGRAAEGVVWRARDAARVILPDGMNVRASFKAISRKYLLKHDR